VSKVPDTFFAYFHRLFEEAHDIMVTRQESYGPGNVENLGPLGVFSRMAMDKVNRIANSMNGKIVNGKAEIDKDWYTPEVHDALIDTINYCAILIALGQEQWSVVSRGGQWGEGEDNFFQYAKAMKSDFNVTRNPDVHAEFCGCNDCV